MNVRTTVDVRNGDGHLIMPSGSGLCDCVPFEDDRGIGVEGNWSSMCGSFTMFVLDGEYVEVDKFGMQK